MKHFLTALAVLILFNPNVIAQYSKAQAYDELTKKAGALRTANAKDVLSNFLQAGVSKLLTDKNALSINPTLYAIDSMLFISNRSNVDTVFKKQRALRNIQLMDSVQFNDFKNDITKVSVEALQIGFKIALLNKKDVRYADFSPMLQPIVDKYANIRKTINLKLFAALPAADDQKRINESWTKYAVTHDYNDLDPLVRAEVEQLDADSQGIIKLSKFHQAFTDLAELYSRKPMLVFTPVYTYDFANSQPGYSMDLNFTQGLNTNVDKKPWELEVKTGLVIQKDTSQSKRNLDNKVWATSGGVNKVLRQTSDKKSTMELKVFLQYNALIGKSNGLGPSNLTFNSTYRLKLFKSVWVPLTLTYDPKNSNLLGFLSLTFNIDKGSSE